MLLLRRILWMADFQHLSFLVNITTYMECRINNRFICHISGSQRIAARSREIFQGSTCWRWKLYWVPWRSPENSPEWAFGKLSGKKKRTKTWATASWWQLKYFFNFHPENWERFPIRLIFLQMGWNHQSVAGGSRFWVVYLDFGSVVHDPGQHKWEKDKHCGRSLASEMRFAFGDWDQGYHSDKTWSIVRLKQTLHLGIGRMDFDSCTPFMNLEVFFTNTSEPKTPSKTYTTIYKEDFDPLPICRTALINQYNEIG